VNYFVDPYNRFGNNCLGVYISAARQTKATQVRRFPHNALLMGDSRMEMMPADRIEHFKFFNAAFSGGTAEEAYYFLEHYASNEEVVVLGVSLGQCDPAPPAGDIFLPAGGTAVLDNVLSLKTLEYSFRTIIDHLERQPASFAPDGSAETITWFRLYDGEDPARQKWQLDGLKLDITNFSWPGGKSLTFYRKIAALLRERGIACVAVVLPMHEEVARQVQSSPARAAYEAWRAELGSIFPDVADLSFSQYDDAGNYFKTDSKHFKPDAGIRMLNQEVVPVALRAVKAGRSAVSN
jgi:hypothetical protein